MPFGAFGTSIVDVLANRRTHALQPQPGPREFDTQYGESDWNDDKRRAGRDNHDDTEYEHCATQHSHSYAARCFVRQMNGLLNHE